MAGLGKYCSGGYGRIGVYSIMSIGKHIAMVLVYNEIGLYMSIGKCLVTRVVLVNVHGTTMR